MPLPTAEELVARLGLQPHPEGGYYNETFRDSLEVEEVGSHLRRSASTSIYFLLPFGCVSHLHRIRYAEVWHFYLATPGASLVVVELDAESRTARRTRLGSDVLGGQRLQHIVPGGVWFGAYVEAEAADAGDCAYALVGCTVAPGFCFQDFVLGDRAELLQAFPSETELVLRLTTAAAS